MRKRFCVLPAGRGRVDFDRACERLAGKNEHLSVWRNVDVAVDGAVDDLLDVVIPESNGPEGSVRLLFRLEVKSLAVVRPEDRLDPGIEVRRETVARMRGAIIDHQLPPVGFKSRTRLGAEGDILPVGGIAGKSVCREIRRELLPLHRGEIDLVDIMVRAPRFVVGGDGSRGG